MKTEVVEMEKEAVKMWKDACEEKDRAKWLKKKQESLANWEKEHGERFDRETEKREKELREMRESRKRMEQGKREGRGEEKRN